MAALDAKYASGDVHVVVLIQSGDVVAEFMQFVSKETQYGIHNISESSACFGILPLVMLAALPAKPLSEARAAAEASTPARLASVPQDPPPLSGAHTIQQRSNGRYLDAHDTPDRDFGVVTRPRQDNATQRWVFRRESGRTYTIQQEHTGRFLDAHDTADRDFRVVTRPPQSNTTQRWLVTHLGGDVYAIQQLNTRRFLDATRRRIGTSLW